MERTREQLPSFKTHRATTVRQIVHLSNAAEFASEVLDAGTKKVVVDFWAPRCGPCRAIAPVLETIAENSSVGAKVVKVNVDEAPEIAAQYQIRGIPTLVFFCNGREIGRHVGMTDRETILAALDRV
ncbi:MAG: thioredoxin [Verrucomicrobia bacterium]|nr:MAG: thioredoxin [Verrucomicrobiota bacterium]